MISLSCMDLSTLSASYTFELIVWADCGRSVWKKKKKKEEEEKKKKKKYARRVWYHRSCDLWNERRSIEKWSNTSKLSHACCLHRTEPCTWSLWHEAWTTSGVSILAAHRLRLPYGVRNYGPLVVVNAFAWRKLRARLWNWFLGKEQTSVLEIDPEDAYHWSP